MRQSQAVQILGPTGVGKSRMALRVAECFEGEVISADAMQVYSGFDIGTAKLGPSEREGISHHLIDIIDDCAQFNVAMFLRRAFDCAETIISRGRLPIVCGGTALYLRSMVRGIFPQSDQRRVSREKLERIADATGIENLWRRLDRIDPEYARRIGKNDRKRIVRGLEIYYNQGKSPSQMFTLNRSPFEKYQIIRIGLNLDRSLLYRRINRRVDRMIEEGLIEEVKRLKKRKAPDCPPFSAVGYREILQYLSGDIDRTETIRLIKQHTRNFAKRQLSWFRQEKDIVWFDPEDREGVLRYIHRTTGIQGNPG